MALESVFANPPPAVGNKETHGQKERFHEFGSDSDGEGPPVLIPADEEDGEIEEGEIIDSGEEAPRLINEITGNSYDNNRSPDSANGESLSSKQKRKKKKKKKKRKLLDDAGNANNDEPIKKPRKKQYVDHDKVIDEEQWFPRPLQRESMERSPCSYDSPYNSSFEDEQDDQHHFQESRDPSLHGRKEGAKKRKNTSGSRNADKKRSRPGRPNMFMGKGPRQRREPCIKRTPCKFFREGKCAKGDDCTFIHDARVLKKRELCKFYVNSFCNKGDNCLFMHREFPCKYFHTGQECFSADQCKFSHEPLTEEGQRILDRYLNMNMDEEPMSPRREIHMSPPRREIHMSPPRRDIHMSPPRREMHMSPPRRDIHMSPRRDIRPSLLGSPPQHVKELAEGGRNKIPSLFDIQVTPAPGSHPPPAPPFGSPDEDRLGSPHHGNLPPRPNFYMDSMNMSPGRPPLLPFPPGSRFPFPDMGQPGFKHEGFYGSPDGDERMMPLPTQDEFSAAAKDVDMRMMPENLELNDSRLHQDDDDDDKPRFDKSNSSESDSECRKLQGPIPVPVHLPKKQRELFLRIQQQQREAESSQEESDRNDSKKEDEEAQKEENWYSSEEDDDDDNDQPLTDVLKKLQQQPPAAKTDRSSNAPSFDIAKMLGMLKNQAMTTGGKSEQGRRPVADKDMRLETRDPRIRRIAKATNQDPAGKADHPMRGSRDAIPNTKMRESRDAIPNTKMREFKVGRGEATLEPSKMPKVGQRRSSTTEVFRDPWGNGDKDMRKSEGPSSGDSKSPPEEKPYRLQAVLTSHPNYSNINFLTTKDPRLKNDPRLKRLLGHTDPPKATVSKLPLPDPDDQPLVIATEPEQKVNNLLSPTHRISPPLEKIVPEVKKPKEVSKPESTMAREDPRRLKVPIAKPSKEEQVPLAWKNSAKVSAGRHFGLPVVTSGRVRKATSLCGKADSSAESVTRQVEIKTGPLVTRQVEIKTGPSVMRQVEIKSVPSVTRRVEIKTAPSAARQAEIKAGAKSSDACSVKKEEPSSVQSRRSSSECSSPPNHSNNDDVRTRGKANGKPKRLTPSPPILLDLKSSVKVEEAKAEKVSDSDEPVVDDLPADDDAASTNASLKEVFQTIDPTASPFC